MDAVERTRRMGRMRATIEQMNIYRWASKILSNLLHFDLPEDANNDDLPDWRAFTSKTNNSA